MTHDHPPDITDTDSYHQDSLDSRDDPVPTGRALGAVLLLAVCAFVFGAVYVAACLGRWLVGR